ncbi:MAG: type II toxin-antitoxin system RelE/ParE family toxin [Rhodocyclaceae bacterium]|nr:type II toxin-antitoxin system RelE/ParE family toxin [Rhodocyclaceae bacterium]
MFEIEFSKNFIKSLDKMPDNIVRELYADLTKMITNPLPSNVAVDIKKLHGKTDHYRLRIGKYRFLFTIIKKQLVVYFFDLGSRGDIYK